MKQRISRRWELLSDAQGSGGYYFYNHLLDLGCTVRGFVAGQSIYPNVDNHHLWGSLLVLVHSDDRRDLEILHAQGSRAAPFGLPIRHLDALSEEGGFGERDRHLQCLDRFRTRNGRERGRFDHTHELVRGQWVGGAGGHGGENRLAEFAIVHGRGIDSVGEGRGDNGIMQGERECDENWLSFLRPAECIVRENGGGREGVEVDAVAVGGELRLPIVEGKESRHSER